MIFIEDLEHSFIYKIYVARANKKSRAAVCSVAHTSIRPGLAPKQPGAQKALSFPARKIDKSELVEPVTRFRVLKQCSIA